MRVYLRNVIAAYRYGSSGSLNKDVMVGVRRTLGIEGDATWDIKRRPDPISKSSKTIALDRLGITLHATGPTAVWAAIEDATQGDSQKMARMRERGLEVSSEGGGESWTYAKPV